jgi:hypothetical protein
LKKFVAVEESGKCVSALIQNMAVLMVTSEATASPTKLREACEEVAKRLVRSGPAGDDAVKRGRTFQ